LGSYGPGRPAAGVVVAAIIVEAEAVGAASAAAGAVEVNGALGYFANGADAMVAAEVAGVATAAVPPADDVVVSTAPGLAAFARFIDEGGATAATAAWGVDCVDGNAGAVFDAVDAVADSEGEVDCATSGVPSVDLPGFHQAQREPDWHPAMPMVITNNIAVWIAKSFIVVLP
jgi:hypothetical protein